MTRKNIKEKIKEYFFMYPNSKLRVREIERTLNLPLPSVIRYCKELEDTVLKTVRIGNSVFYTSDRNETYLIEKKLFNIKQLYESGIIGYLRIKLHNPVIILFGSYFKGEDSEESDIDLYIESKSKQDIDAKDFEKKLRRKLQIFIHDDLTNIKNIHLRNNIINGITVNGQLEVFK